MNKTEKVTTPSQEKNKFTPEQLDEQIIIEANKLKVGIESIHRQIVSFGGPEKFKKHFEQYVGHDESHGNLAGKETEELSKKIKDANFSSLTNVAGGVGALAVLAILDLYPGEAISDTLLIVINIVWGLNIIKQFVNSIESRVTARKIDNEKKIDDLKFKMTDTKIEHDQWR